MRAKRAVVGVGIVALTAWGAPGCMPDRLVVGQGSEAGPAGADSGGQASGFGPDAGGHGGTTVVGSSGSGAEAAAPPLAGRGGARGSAGAGGKRPTDVGGGGGKSGGSGGRGGSGGVSAGTGGTSSSQGGAPDIEFDPECDCQLVNEEFVCTTTAEHFALGRPVPSDCENDLDYVRRSTCTSATEVGWSEGGENDYLVKLDGDTLLSGYAAGYVGGICGVSYTAPLSLEPYGTVTAGADTSSDCSDWCMVCGADAFDPAPSCEVCTPAPDEPGVALESLAAFCTQYACPSSIEEARTMLGAPCSPPSVPPPRLVTTGCGFIVVSDSLLGFKSFVFDAVTKELVGASDGSDLGRGPCQATMYRGGNVPTEVCADATTCNFCTVSDTGAAGAADAPSSYPQCEPP